jgi:hypothetical protein
VVTENATLYEPGRVLTDQPVYLRSVARSPTLIQTTTVSADQRVSVTQRIVLEYRAEWGDETFWRDSTTVSQVETTTRSGRVRTSARLDPGAIRSRLGALRETVGDAGSAAVDLRLVASYATPRYEGTLTETVGLGFGDRWYRIDTPSVSKTHSTPVTRVVAVPSRQRDAYAGLGALGVVAVLLGLGSASLSRIESRRSDAGDLAFERHRLRYAEWISTGTVPDDAGETVVAVASLEELVDVAVDTDKRVIHDPTRDRYVVVDGPTVYCHHRLRSS